MSSTDALTPQEAKAKLCPLARTFIQAGPTTLSDAGCKGPSCAVWRWEKITTQHPLWRDAVKRVADEIGDKVPYAKASKIVADDLEAYGMKVERGMCGLGGPL